jgi:hypothetical protein
MIDVDHSTRRMTTNMSLAVVAAAVLTAAALVVAATIATPALASTGHHGNTIIIKSAINKKSVSGFGTKVTQHSSNVIITHGSTGGGNPGGGTG